MPELEFNRREPAPLKLEQLERIVLTGFMGAGKTTVGRLLAERTGWQFTDLDDILERAAGKTIAALFRDEGEAAFRHRESLALAEAMELRQTVLALGGGAIERAANLERIRATPATLLVFLNAPLPALLDRLAAQQADGVRPLLLDAQSLQRRYESRLPAYHSADRVIDTVNHTPEEVTAAILDPLQS